MAPAFVQDTFTDVAGTSLLTHVGELGATWTKGSSFNSGAEVITPANTSRNNATFNSLWYSSGTPPTADYYVEADFLFVSIPANLALAINVRQQAGASTFYSLRYSSTSNGWFITKTIAGSQSTLVSALVAAAVGSTKRARLVASGSTLTAYLDGVQVLTVNDTAITGAGFAGFARTGSATSSDTTGMQLDNFVAGTIDTGATGTGTTATSVDTTSMGAPAVAGTGGTTGTVAATSSGSPATASASSGAVAITATSSGVARFSGTATATIIDAATSSGTPSAAGSGAASVSADYSASSPSGYGGQGAATFAITATSSGVASIRQATTATFTLDSVATAKPAAAGAASVALAVAFARAGSGRFFGSSAASMTLTAAGLPLNPDLYRDVDVLASVKAARWSATLGTGPERVGRVAAARWKARL